MELIHLQDTFGLNLSIDDNLEVKKDGDDIQQSKD